MEEFKISKRLEEVAAWLDKGGVIADVGTDHAYLPIYIISQGISEKVIAMDVRKKPLERAAQNTRELTLKGNIELRLSDGLDGLGVKEADSITICGMGGRLIQRILSDGSDKYDENTQLLLSPQSELREFRYYLKEKGFSVLREKMIKEDNQYYVIMDCRKNGNVVKEDREIYLRYGKYLIDHKDTVLFDYLTKELTEAKKLYEIVHKAGAQKRAEQVLSDIKYIEEVMDCFKKE